MKPPKMPLCEQTPGRICWCCVHVYFLSAEQGWSEYTPASDFQLECGKGYWSFENFDDTLDDFRHKLESAERCADFKAR